MTAATAQLLDAALSLPDEERAGLAAELLASLVPATQAEERTEDEWLGEVERRARAALAGSPGVSWEAARAELDRRRMARR